MHEHNRSNRSNCCKRSKDWTWGGVIAYLCDFAVS